MVILNERPPHFKTYHALYIEYLALLKREGKESLTMFSFWHRSDKVLTRHSLLEHEANFCRYNIEVAWLEKQLLPELLVTRNRFTPDDLYELRNAVAYAGRELDGLLRKLEAQFMEAIDDLEAARNAH